LIIQGLSTAEVSDRIHRGLQNRSSKPKTKTISEIFIENIFSVFNLVILSIIIFLLYFYLKSSDQRLVLDSIGILTIAFINTFLGIYQEIRAKKALDKVNLLLKKEVTVVRNGIDVQIEPAEIVKDDVIKISRGDQVVVDGQVLLSNRLEIDESLLTGESNPIQKKENDEILSGSFCISGNGYYTAEKIGDDSFAAQITSTAKKYKFDLTPLQKRINLIVKILFAIAIVLVLLEILFDQSGFTADFVRKVSTILISLVPQGLVLTATITFALGVFRISKLGAIIQKLNAIESFSNVQIVCTDKTGTLTQNKLSVHKLTVLDSGLTEENIKMLIGTYAHLTTDKNATAIALTEFSYYDDYKLVDEYPFNSERKLSIIKMQVGESVQTYILGAFDVLIERTSDFQKKEAINQFEKSNLQIYRNLLFGTLSNKIDLEQTAVSSASTDITPLCIISIKDIIRDDVFDAIKLFEDNDIKIKILSGDSAKAVQEVANQIGWNISDNELITGNDLDKIGDSDLAVTVMSKTVFARLKPEHKLRIIKSLKKEKIYTAMIGDGVNDLPAIKESDMGIAMEEGSAITKEVADIVLLKNKFSLLPSIFEEGNRIVNSVKSVGKLFITKNFFVIYISLLSIFFLLEFPLTPRRVSLINIFGIGLPAFIIALKNTNTEKTKHFMKDLISFVLLSALIIVAAGYSGIAFVQKRHGVSETELQMVMLTIMIITNIANYFSIVLVKYEINKEQLTYLLYGFMILLLFIFLASTGINSGIIYYIKLFYEIEYIRKDLWPIILTISLISSAVLFVLQRLRLRFFKLNNHVK